MAVQPLPPRLEYNHRRVNEGQAYSPVMIGDFLHNLPRFAYLKFGG